MDQSKTSKCERSFQVLRTFIKKLAFLVLRSRQNLSNLSEVRTLSLNVNFLLLSAMFNNKVQRKVSSYNLYQVQTDINFTKRELILNLNWYHATTDIIFISIKMSQFVELILIDINSA